MVYLSVAAEIRSRDIRKYAPVRKHIGITFNDTKSIIIRFVNDPVIVQVKAAFFQEPLTYHIAHKRDRVHLYPIKGYIRIGVCEERDTALRISAVSDREHRIAVEIDRYLITLGFNTDRVPGPARQPLIYGKRVKQRKVLAVRHLS